MIGILAYGSLLADPGWEIADQMDHIIRPVETPFPVEYARKSKTRAGAPTLIPVPEGKGSPVQAAVIVLKPETSLEQARDILYRREIHRVGDSKKRYPLDRQPNHDLVTISEISGFTGLERVLYTALGCNFPEILDDSYSDFEKVELLSIAARDSLTEKTFHTCKDGLAYLAAALYFGVRTRLTSLFGEAVRALAGGAQDLAEARVILARQKGLVE